MKAVTKFLAGAAVVAVAAGGFAAPAAAQSYPGYGYPGTGGGIGQILDVILNAQRYGYGYQGYASDRVMIDRCAAAVEQRINRDYGYRYGTPYGAPYSGYGTYGGQYGGAYGGQYGYNQYAAGGAKVVGISRVERRSGSTIRVRGVATANAYANQYASPYGGQYGQYGSPYGGQYGQYGGQYGAMPYGYTQAGELRFKCDIDYRGHIRDIDLDRNDNAYYGYRRY